MAERIRRALPRHPRGRARGTHRGSRICAPRGPVDQAKLRAHLRVAPGVPVEVEEAEPVQLHSTPFVHVAHLDAVDLHRTGKRSRSA